MGNLVESKHEHDFLKELKGLISSLTVVRGEVSHLIQKAKSMELKLLPVGERLILDSIMDKACLYYQVNEDQVAGDNREGRVMKARRVYGAMSHEMTKLGYSHIGRSISKDHATIMNSCKKMNNFKYSNDILYDEYKEIQEMVKARLKEIKFARTDDVL